MTKLRAGFRWRLIGWGKNWIDDLININYVKSNLEVWSERGFHLIVIEIGSNIIWKLISIHKSIYSFPGYAPPPS